MVASVKVYRTIEVDAPGLGELIKEARKNDERTLGKISAAAGMSSQNWYRIEEERQSLPEETLRLIEKVLQVDFGVSFETEEDD
ncbi:MAG: helix-turn-helix transcriptional regulator [Cyanobacteria bacterium P01_D01_bin.115]